MPAAGRPFGPPPGPQSGLTWTWNPWSPAGRLVSSGVIRNPAFVSDRPQCADLLTDPVGIDRIHGNRLVSGISRARSGYENDCGKRHDAGFHMVLTSSTLPHLSSFALAVCVNADLFGYRLKGPAPTAAAFSCLWAFTFAAAAYNLVRLPKLAAEKG